MEIIAREYFHKCKWLSFISCKLDSVTAFGDHRVKFDFHNHRVVRSGASGTKIIAQIHRGYKGAKLSEFFGTIESETFIVTKRKKNWFSVIAGSAEIEITLKDTSESVVIHSQRYDFDTIHKVGNIFELQLMRSNQTYDRSLRIEGSCADEYQDLGEVLVCILLHHNEDTSSIS